MLLIKRDINNAQDIYVSTITLGPCTHNEELKVIVKMQQISYGKSTNGVSLFMISNLQNFIAIIYNQML